MLMDFLLQVFFAVNKIGYYVEKDSSPGLCYPA